MEVTLDKIFHLEEFLLGNKKYIKIASPMDHRRRRNHKTPKKALNAVRRPGVKEFVYFPPEIIVRRIRPHNPSSGG